jgi:CRP-like cAMP-binding protein
MAQRTENIQAWLKALPLFSSLKEGDVADLFHRSQVKELAKGDTLFLQGEPAGNFYIVISGWIKLFRETGDGHESVAGLCTAEDTFGEAVLYQGSTYPFGAQAVEPSRALRVPAAAVKELIQRNGDFAATMIQAMSQRMQTLELQVEHLKMMTAPQRIGCFLLKLCRGKSMHNVELALPYDKGLVAALLGIKLETFSRSLHQLKPVGIEVNGPAVIIADVQKLRDYACASCSTVPEECNKESGKK